MRLFFYLALCVFLSSKLFSNDVKVSFDSIGAKDSDINFQLFRLAFDNTTGEEKPVSIDITSGKQLVRQRLILPPNARHIEAVPFWAGVSTYVDLRVVVDGKNYNFSHSNYSSYGSGKKNDDCLVLVVTDEMKSLSNVLVGTTPLALGNNLNRVSYIDLPKTATELCVYDLIVVDRVEFEKKHSQAKLLLQRYAGVGGKLLFLNSSNPFGWEEKIFGDVYHRAEKADQFIDVEKELDIQAMRDFQANFQRTDSINFDLDNNKMLYLFSLGIFTLLAGLFNFYRLKKMNKMYLIYITLPVFSLIFCFLILLTYMFEEGSKKLYHGNSVTFLDPISQNASTIALTKTYQSFAGSGIAVPPYTFCKPNLEHGYRYGAEYFVDRGEMQILSGSYHASRKVSQFLSFQHEETTLISKILSSSPNTYEIKNGLPYSAKFYVLDTKNRKTYALFEEVAPEAKCVLSLVTDITLIRQYNYELNNALADFLNKHKGLYLVALCKISDFAPFGNDNSYNNINSKHYIVQRLD